jgi:hypothetical protein
MLKNNTLKLLEPYLLPEEKLIWSDKPHRFPMYVIVFFGLAALFIIMFFILPISIAILTKDVSILQNMNMELNGQDVTENTSMSTLKSMLVFSLIMLFGYVLLAWAYVKYRMSEVYGLTNRRGIIIRTHFPKAKISLNLYTLTTIERTGSVKTGTLTFYGPNAYGLKAGVLKMIGLQHSFINIKKPVEIEKLVLHNFQASQERKQS